MKKAELTVFGWLIPPEEEGDFYLIPDSYKCCKCGTEFAIEWSSENFEVVYAGLDRYVTLDVDGAAEPLCLECGGG